MLDFPNKKCFLCASLHKAEEQLPSLLEQALDTEHLNLAPTKEQLAAAGKRLQELEEKNDETQKDLLRLEEDMIRVAEDKLRSEDAVNPDPDTPLAVEELEKKIAALEEEIAEPAEIPSQEQLLEQFKYGLEAEKREQVYENIDGCDEECQDRHAQTDRLLNKLTTADGTAQVKDDVDMDTLIADFQRKL